MGNTVDVNDTPKKKFMDGLLENETEQKKRIALLFDLTKMSEEQQKAFDKLSKAQKQTGNNEVAEYINQLIK